VRLLGLGFQTQVFCVVPHRSLIDHFPGNGEFSLQSERV
jgi:hypothetical protein